MLKLINAENVLFLSYVFSVFGLLLGLLLGLLPCSLLGFNAEGDSFVTTL